MLGWVQQHRRRRDEGFSLIEVVIAAVILGFVSIALLNGLNTVNLTSRQQHVPTQEYANLATAEVLIQRATFTACTTNANPYSSLTSQLSAINIVIPTVKGIPASDTTQWYTCGTSWPVDGSGNPTAAPTVLQQVFLKSTIGRQTTRSVFKASNGSYPVGTDGTSVFSVSTGTAINLVNIPSGCSPSLCTGTATLSATALPSNVTSSNLIYFVMGANPTDTVASVSGTTLTMTAYASGGTPWVLVGAFDKTTNTLARPIRFYENLISVPTLAVSYPAANPTYYTAIAGYGFYPTTQTPAVTATLPSGYTTPTYSTTSTVFAVNSSTGAITIPTPANLTTTGTLSVPMAASCCSFTDPNAKGTLNVSVKVSAAVAYTSSSLSAVCTGQSFKTATSSSNPCVITTTLTGGSLNTTQPTAMTSSNFNVKSQVYTVTATGYTVATSIYYKTNGYCKTGTSASLAIGDLNFTDSGTTQTVSNTAAITGIKC